MFFLVFCCVAKAYKSITKKGRVFASFSDVDRQSYIFASGSSLIGGLNAGSGWGTNLVDLWGLGKMGQTKELI